MQILFRYFSIRLGIEKVPMPFSKRLLKISKAPAIKTGTRLNLHVKRGRIYGLLGRNGAGKTTTMKMLLGLTKPTSGEVKIWGKS